MPKSRQSTNIMSRWIRQFLLQLVTDPQLICCRHAIPITTIWESWACWGHPSIFQVLSGWLLLLQLKNLRETIRMNVILAWFENDDASPHISGSASCFRLCFLLQLLPLISACGWAAEIAASFCSSDAAEVLFYLSKCHRVPLWFWNWGSIMPACCRGSLAFAANMMTWEQQMQAVNGLQREKKALHVIIGYNRGLCPCRVGCILLGLLLLGGWVKSNFCMTVAIILRI
jgi:hypothetical protein